jgi:hypothetical protein
LKRCGGKETTHKFLIYVAQNTSQKDNKKKSEENFKNMYRTYDIIKEERMLGNW